MLFTSRSIKGKFNFTKFFVNIFNKLKLISLQVNPEFAVEKGKKIDFADLDKIIKKLREEWGMFSICDIVLNHTANESEWLKTNPESTYSCATCPYLRPAFLLDALLAQIGTDVAEGKLETHGVPSLIETEDHLQALKHYIMSLYLDELKLHEFFQCDIETHVTQFSKLIVKIGVPAPEKRHHGHEEENFELPSRVILKSDPEYRRYGYTVNLDKAIDLYNLNHEDTKDEAHRLQKCAKQFRKALLALNDSIHQEITADLVYGIDNCLAGARYERIQSDGPKVKGISVKYPLFQNYFTKWGTKGKTIKEIEKMMYTDEGRYFMAHNGWVMSADSLNDFAAPQPGDRNVYFRRELIAWGDSVKLRFGQQPSDSPYLWKHMQKYVETSAKLFDGVRLDNCHSTPLHVAEYLLDCAR